MDLSEVISIIENPGVWFQAERDTISLPWDVKSSEYLRFAETDVQSNDRRGAVNALANAKRALECQIDSLIIAFEMANIASRWRFPAKVEALGKIGLVAPRILAKVNRHRNEMEHKYICPPLEVVRDFVDVVALFIESTKFHIADRRCTWVFDLGEGQGARVELGSGYIRFSSLRKGDESVEVAAGSEGFFRLLYTIGRETEWQSSGILDWRAS
jgi:hypothetical protein